MIKAMHRFSGAFLFFFLKVNCQMVLNSSESVVTPRESVVNFHVVTFNNK